MPLLVWPVQRSLHPYVQEPLIGFEGAGFTFSQRIGMEAAKDEVYDVQDVRYRWCHWLGLIHSDSGGLMK